MLKKPIVKMATYFLLITFIEEIKIRIGEFVKNVLEKNHYLDMTL